jgi:hypothetical protein
VAALAFTSLVIAPAAAKPGEATVSVLHAIPAGKGADIVDVYANGKLLAADATPGTLKTMKVPAGTYDVIVLPDGASPKTGTPLVAASGVKIRSGKNVTVAAHLSSAGRTTLTTFVNDNSTVGMGMGRITVRHIAQAPAVDVRANGSTIIRGLRNGKQGDAGVMAGNYRVEAVPADTQKPVLKFSTVTVTNAPGRQDMGNNSILYIWGSAADGTLNQARQSVQITLQR